MFVKKLLTTHVNPYPPVGMRTVALICCVVFVASCGEKVDMPCAKGDEPYCDDNVAWNCIGGELHTGTIPYRRVSRSCPQNTVSSPHPESTECAVVDLARSPPSRRDARCVMSTERGAECPEHSGTSTICLGTKVMQCVDGYLVYTREDCADTGQTCQPSSVVCE